MFLIAYLPIHKVSNPSSVSQEQEGTSKPANSMLQAQKETKIIMETEYRKVFVIRRFFRRVLRVQGKRMHERCHDLPADVRSISHIHHILSFRPLALSSFELDHSVHKQTSGRVNTSTSSRVVDGQQYDLPLRALLV